ncbi:MAG: hypothetical protein AAGA46_16910 [Cyanobacteria bacterium P01_F01_bin.13]
MQETARVLKPDGILTFTVWPEPEPDNDFLGLIQKVCHTYAALDVNLPPAPSSSALADSAIRDPMLTEAGFGNIHTQVLDLRWPLQGPETMVTFLLKGTVRTRMLYARQTPEVQTQIRDALVAETMPYIQAGQDSIACPGLLVTGCLVPSA